MSLEEGLRRIAWRPQFAVWGAVGLLAGAAWVYLAFAAAALDPAFMGGAAALFPDWTAMVAALCRVDPAAGIAGSAATGFVMWAAMCLAMMLPAAAPMMASYLDIAEAARAKGVRVAPPAVLLAGYLAVWFAFAAVCAVLQAVLAARLMLTPDIRLAAPQIAGGLLMLAGLYQFTPLKSACLVKCRRPMTVFMGGWRDDAGGIFRLGLAQGAYCVGCCWALMLAMFAVGLMNLAWMAAFAAIMVLEKTLGDPRYLKWGVGACLVATGAAAILA